MTKEIESLLNGLWLMSLLYLEAVLTSCHFFIFFFLIFYQVLCNASQIQFNFFGFGVGLLKTPRFSRCLLTNSYTVNVTA